MNTATLRSTLTTVVVSAAALGLATGPAYAGNFATSVPGAQVNWVDDPNRMLCHDTGTPQAAFCMLQKPDGSTVTLLNSNGNGTSVSATYPGMAENQPIAILACTGLPGSPVRCTNWFNGTS